MADSVIKEGFLCPICMQDLGSVADLQTHFDVAHAGEDKAVLNQLKDIFGKAKQKILSSMKKEKESEDVYSAFSAEDNEPVSDAGRLNAGGIDPTMWEPQEIGATRSYTDGFKRYRDARMDRFVVETNKLIIRLDKLLSTDAPTEASKRKAFEKSVVPWAPDKDVTLCTACGKSFSLTRRRHHCRLCGGIICNRCSHFLPFCYARALTDPAYQYQGEGFRRSSSTSSLNSILSPEGEPHIRTCQPCRTLLERRDQQIEQRNRKPFVVQLYQKMRAYMDESNRILPKFLDMAESLHSGETTYNLREATAYRAQLVKLFENIELISKRIYTLGTSDPEETPSPTALRLQKMVRSHASSYLTQNMMGLVSLPSDADLTVLQEQKTLEAQQRVEDERRRAAERAQRAPPPRDLPSSIDPPKKPDKSPTDSQKSNESLGWKPAEISLGNSDDPMIQQMSIIRGYARQARQAGRWDEVKMLEDNLRELQKEYWRQAEVDKEQQAASQARVGAHGATQQEQTPPRQQQQPQQQARQPSQPQQQTQARQQQPRQQPQPQRQSPQRQLNTQRQQQSQPQQQHRTSPRKTPPRGSPVKTLASKDSSLNPFDEDEDVDGDEMNPFSANYKDQNPFHQGNDLNPFS